MHNEKRSVRHRRIMVALVTALALSAVVRMPVAQGAPTLIMPPQPVHIKVGTPAPLGLALFWDLQIADARGLFRQNNLVPEFVQFAGPGPAIQALVAGSVNVVSAATDAAVFAIDAGAPIKFIAGQSFAGHALAASPDIASYQALKGKRIATTDLQTGTTVVLRALLEKHGLSSQDYELIPIADRYGALRAGAVQAALLAPPLNFEARAAGFNILGYVDDAVPDYLISAHLVNTRFAAAHQAALVAYVRAVRNAQRWLWSPAHEAGAVAILMQNSKLTHDVAEQTYRMVIGRRLMTRDGRITPLMMQTLFGILAQTGHPAGSHEFDHYVDMSYLRKAGG